MESLIVLIWNSSLATDAIQKIIARRRIPSDIECKLYQDDEQLADDAYLQQCIFVSSGDIQVRFKSNDLDVDFHGHSLHSNHTANSLLSVQSLPNRQCLSPMNGMKDDDGDQYFQSLRDTSNAAKPKKTKRSRHQSDADLDNIRSAKSLPNRNTNSDKYRKRRSKTKHRKPVEPLPRRSMLKTQNLTAIHSFAIQHTDDNDGIFIFCCFSVMNS